ncbi:PREDICTED: histone-lysine N-methyltransferase SETMAR-like isoform X2 [Acromyrmex echinatior]|uniref:histone-lysine N-methyltransferase SETMAR-like isoform X2 n=1 Tax=Acromyrmex echinatior TaxID=103372 RepID=UPI000580DED4|nr:PREDICTED: histone-lysine N-methyltransferase SETMAR-like isoform X2 [Acromyrmex echinatior]
MLRNGLPNFVPEIRVLKMDPTAVGPPRLIRMISRQVVEQDRMLKMPHKLNEENLANRMSICNSLLKRHESDPFLKRMTDDEKWIIYDIVRKRSWRTAGKSPNAIPKAYIQRRFCYPYGGIIVMRFYELFPQGKTIDSKVYCTQLTKLNQA